MAGRSKVEKATKGKRGLVSKAASALLTSTDETAMTTTKTSKKKTKQPMGTPLDRFASSFYAVPLKRKPLLSDALQEYVKYLFVKEKVASIEEQMTAETIDKTLIVVNVSLDDTEETLRSLFDKLIPHVDEAAGRRITVEIGKDRIALIKFVNMEEDLEPKLRALTQEECIQVSESLDEGDRPVQTCVERWLQAYKSSRPDRASIGKAADERIKELEEQEQEQREASRMPIVDEDGFTLVVSKKGKAVPDLTKKKKRDPSAVVTTSKATEPKKKKGRLMDENLSFYKFERRRLRNKEVSRLKDQFKNDRKRAMRLKQELAVADSN